jgi:alkylation response protein AidB-like acyl-CoA dehydrogenase
MRLVGGIGLEKENQFERFFRDARSGLINPPIEARALETIAEHALQHPDNKFLI